MIKTNDIFNPQVQLKQNLSFRLKLFLQDERGVCRNVGIRNCEPVHCETSPRH